MERVSCVCHAPEHRDRALGRLPQKGHMVAYGYAEGVSDTGIGEAEAWDAARHCDKLGFLADGVGAVRMTAALAKEKVGVLAQGAILLGTVGRGRREGGSDDLEQRPPLQSH